MSSHLNIELESSFFNISIHPPEKDPQSFQIECGLAAHKIQQRAIGRPIQIAMSGGLDSEVMALSFLKEKIPFEAVIMKFNDDLNRHDIQFAIDFCNRLSVPYRLVPLDLEKFYASETHLEYAKKYLCHSPQFATHIWLAQQRNGFIVFSGSPLRFRLKNLTQVLDISNALANHQMTLKENMTFHDPPLPDEVSVARSLVDAQQNSCGESQFFISTPELIASSLKLENPFLESAFIETLATEKSVTDFDNQVYFHSKWINHRQKLNFYQQAGFNVESRPSKFNGFEGLHNRLGQATTPVIETSHQQLLGLEIFNRLYRTPMQIINGGVRHGLVKLSAPYWDWLKAKALPEWNDQLKNFLKTDR